MNKYEWNPFDFHYDFWFQAAHGHNVWCQGASTWVEDDVNLFLMGGEL